MSNIDKLMEKLKSAALKLNCEQWQTRNGFSGVEVIVKGSVAKGHGCVSYQPVASELVDTKTAKAIALFCPANILALLDELEAKDKRITKLSTERAKGVETLQIELIQARIRAEAAEKRIAEMQALASGVKQFSEFQICHYGTTEDYAEGYIDCQSNYNKVLFAAAGKGEAS